MRYHCALGLRVLQLPFEITHGVKRMKFFLSILLIALLLTLNVQAQKTDVETKHFEKAGLAFDYPADWKLIDSSTDNLQYVTVTSKDSAVQVAVITQLGNDQQCDFQTASAKIRDALLESIGTLIHAARPLHDLTGKNSRRRPGNRRPPTPRPDEPSLCYERGLFAPTQPALC